MYLAAIFSCFCLTFAETINLSQTGLDCRFGVVTLQKLRQIARCLPEGNYYYVAHGRKCTFITRLRRPICGLVRDGNFVCASFSDQYCPPSTTTTDPTTLTTTSSTMLPTTTLNLCLPCLPCTTSTSTTETSTFSMRHYHWLESLLVR